MPVSIFNTPLISDSSLEFYLRFEDVWTDSSTNAYDLTAVNSPNFVTGPFGKAGNFVAASSQEANRAAASMANVMIATTQSWMFWIKPSFVSNNYTLGRSTGGNWFMYNDNGGVENWASGLSVGHAVTLPSSTDFHHVCFVYDSGVQKIWSYINGAVVQNGVDVTGSVSGAGTNFAVGRIGDFPGYGTFAMDDLAMFNRRIVQEDLNLIFPRDKNYFYFM